jgi:hypothetical protein
VSGGKSRGDFTATVNGKAMGSHMIMDGKTSYIWTDGQTQGFKMSVDAAATATAKDQAAAQQSFDANKKLNYSCSAWSADSAMFSLPAGVQFTDMSAMLQKK